MSPELLPPCVGLWELFDSKRNVEKVAVCDTCPLVCEYRATKAPTPSRDSACGTPAGHQRHTRAKEKVCEPCRLAFNQDRRERYARLMNPESQRAGKWQARHKQYDAIVVERILAGDWKLSASTFERHVVVAHWIAEGRGSLKELARLTGWKTERYRAKDVA